MLYGKTHKAVVTRVVMWKGSPRVRFEFEIDNKKYKGDIGIFPDYVEVGDTFMITYLPSDPSVNQRLGDE